MKLNYLNTSLSTLGRWLATTVLCVSTIAAIGCFGPTSGLFSASAMAAPTTHLIAASDLGSQAQDKASKDAGRTKGFVRDLKDKVKQTAQDNASKVEQATDGNGSFVERKAKKDAATVAKRAEQDAARTQKAVDKTKNAVQDTVDKIKDAFN